MRGSRIHGFKNAYSKEFLEKLAKDLGFEWTYVKPQTMKLEDVPVCPMPPPSATLFFIEKK